MLLLKPGRMLQDEGWLRTLKIGCNIITHPQARKRIMQMRRVFEKYQDHMNAIVVIAEKC